MPSPIINVDQVRKDLRRMLERDKQKVLTELNESIIQIERYQAEGDQRKAREVIESIEAKKVEVGGIYEPFFEFIENAQFPEDTI